MKITIAFLLALGLAQASVIPHVRLAAFNGPHAYGYGILGAGGLVQSSSLIAEPVIGLKALPVGLTSGVAVAPAPALVSNGLFTNGLVANGLVGPTPFLTLGAAPVVAQESTAPVETTSGESPASDDSVAVEAELKDAPAEEPVVAAEEVPAPAPAPIEEAAPVEAAPAEEAAPVEEAAPAAVESAVVEPALPVPVDDTIEVAQARAAHLAAVEDAKLRNALAEKVYVAGPVAYSAPVAYPAPVVSIGAPALRYPVPSVQYAPTIVRAPAVVPAPIAVAAPGVVSSQYHSQDELGQYSYGYAGGPSAKDEIKTFDGVTRGGYSYVDANGIVQSTSYVSDPVHGFRVASTNLPVGPAPTYLADTPEVAEAKANLLKLQAEHIAKL